MQADFIFDVLALTNALSHNRVDPFKKDGEIDNIQWLSRYCWNLTLSEALYTPLQNVEIALRNALYRPIAEDKGKDWLLPARQIILQDKERLEVEKAIEFLSHHKKAIEPSRVVAELNFGFWTGLLNRRYEHKLWPFYLQRVFPFAPARERKRRIFSERFDRIRKLRNRVFHHEPIWRWDDLRERHQEILEAIHWMSPSLAQLVTRTDRFLKTYDDGFEPYVDIVKDLLKKENAKPGILTPGASAPGGASAP